MDSPAHAQLAQQFFGDFVGKPLSHAGNQHPFGIVRDSCRARHAVIEQSARATNPVAAIDRLVQDAQPSVPQALSP